jgi:hypothetical protein
MQVQESWTDVCNCVSTRRRGISDFHRVRHSYIRYCRLNRPQRTSACARRIVFMRVSNSVEKEVVGVWAGILVCVYTSSTDTKGSMRYRYRLLKGPCATGTGI